MEVKGRGEELRVHGIMAHGEVPEDILKASVFLGLLMVSHYRTQAKILDDRGEGKKKIPDPFDVEKTLKWIEDSMGLEPTREWLSMFYGRFWDWVRAI